MTNEQRFATPTRPFTLIDAINRSALATGSMTFARLGADADYNGHRVRVYYNDYRKYWLAEYVWAGRRVLHRGSFLTCLKAAQDEHNRGALGSRIEVTLPENARTECDDPETLLRQIGFLPMAEAEAVDSEWFSDYHRLVPHALAVEKRNGLPCTAALIELEKAGEPADQYFSKANELMAR